MCKRLKYFSIICCLWIIGFTPLFANTTTPHKHPKKATTPSKTSSKTHSAYHIPPANVSIQQGIERIISSFGHNANFGVIVQSTATGNTLYQYNANRNFTPASTLKLFTAAAALTYLDPNSVLSTQFFAPNMPRKGTVDGNLYVKFNGDPTLTIQDLKGMVAILNRDGIRTIRGNLVIDDTALDHSNTVPGRVTEDEVLCYAAPATSVILNRNCFGLHLAANSKANTHAQVKIYDNLANISIVNQVITRHAKSWECPLDLKPTGNNTYLLKGCLPPNHHPLALSVALNDPHRAIADVMVNLFRQQGITVTGTISYGATPSDSTLLIEHDSPPLRTLITRMLKKSDNLIADSLFKRLGATYFNTTGTWAGGSQAMRAILTPKTGINFNNLTIVDGSGLSRDNAVSPLHFAQLLNYAYRSLPTSDILYEALPNSGIDGTLRYRLGGSALGKVRAKTGTMKNNYTSGLAGYVESASHQTYTFAILINGLKGSQATYHLLEDRICQFLAQK